MWEETPEVPRTSIDLTTPPDQYANPTHVNTHEQTEPTNTNDNDDNDDDDDDDDAYERTEPTNTLDDSIPTQNGGLGYRHPQHATLDAEDKTFLETLPMSQRRWIGPTDTPSDHRRAYKRIFHYVVHFHSHRLQEYEKLQIKCAYANNPDPAQLEATVHTWTRC